MPGERWLIERDVADQIERVEVFADFFQQRVEYQTLLCQFLDDRFLTLGAFPAGEEFIEAGVF